MIQLEVSYSYFSSTWCKFGNRWWFRIQNQKDSELGSNEGTSNKTPSEVKLLPSTSGGSWTKVVEWISPYFEAQGAIFGTG